MENKEINELLNEQKKEIAKIKEIEDITNLKDYYLNQYHEMFTAIIQNRSREINDDMVSIDTEIQNLTASIDSIDTQIERNEANLLKIQDLEDAINQKFSEIEEERFLLDAKQAKLQKDSIALFNEYYKITDSFKQALKAYYEGTIANGALIEAIDSLKAVLNERGLDIAWTIKANERMLKANELSFTHFEEEKRLAIDKLITEKEQIQKKIITSSNLSKAKIKEDLELRIAHKKSYLNELINTYNELSTKQLKEFNDLYVKNQLLNKEVDEQMAEYDALLKRFKSKLLTIDTPTNQVIKRQKHLNELVLEKERLDQLMQKKKGLEAKKEKWVNLLVQSEETIKEVTKYVNSLKAKITSHNEQNMLSKEKQFQDNLEKMKDYITSLQQELNALNDERTFQMFNPAPDVIREIDQKVLNKEQEIKQAYNDYQKMQKDYEELKVQIKDSELKKLISDSTYFEENLLKANNYLKTLKEKIASNNQLITELTNDLSEYQNIVTRIKELKDEDNN